MFWMRKKEKNPLQTYSREACFSSHRFVTSKQRVKNKIKISSSSVGKPYLYRDHSEPYLLFDC